MKQANQDKYNVAWFKLAEFVSRGEKERALALFRLLSHSFDDKAFAQQLEADILLAFSDEAAYGHYGKAASLYAAHGRYTEAAAVYEHMITLEPHTQEQLEELVTVYKKMPKNVRIFESTQHILRCLMSNGEFEKVSYVLELIDDPSQFAVVHQELVTAWLKVDNPPTGELMVHVKKIIDHYFSIKQQKSLQTFLITLKMLHDLLYQKACAYMSEGNFKV